MAIKGWVIYWKNTKQQLAGLFETKTDAIANAIFNDIQEDVYYKQITIDEEFTVNG